MIHKELLAILCCPETKQDVVLADAGVIEKINGDIIAGTAVSRHGAKVVDAIDGGLIREDGKYLYPIREDIPIMLVDQAIPIKVK
jgi:uncharacterized protein YbaR (Trm112 family)